MKKLHILLVKTFIGPFLATFGISIFLMLMQFLWKYIGDLVGKGLEWYIILEFIVYSIPYLIPRALPLAVLLSTIMVFGNLGERYELVALKSAGISLLRAMVPMFYVMLVIAGLAFYSSNVLIPKANLSWGALFYDLTNKKPALNIQDGIFFNQLRGVSIRVGHKHDDNKTLDDVLIYSKTSRSGISNVLIAKKGLMDISPDKRFLHLTLYDGEQYQEMTDNQEYGRRYQHSKMSFDQYHMAIDMSELELKRSNPEMFKDNYDMLNLNEIEDRVDSIQVLIGQKKEFLKQYLSSYFEFPIDSTVKRYNFDSLDRSQSYEQYLVSVVDTFEVYPKNFNDELPEMDIVSASPIPGIKIAKPQLPQRSMVAEKLEYSQILQNANQATRNIHRIIENSVEDIDRLTERKRRYSIQWHKKFTLAASCLLLFFIGAPLGAIIRKGGFGTPMIISILLFIVYFILQTVGEKLAREAVLEVWSGAWFAVMIFFPFALFLTYKSSRESALFDGDVYRRFFSKLNIWSR